MSRWRLPRPSIPLPVGFGVDTAGCLLLVFLYVWLVIDPRLTHHSLGILSYYYPFSFHTGWAFLEEHWTRPGGLAEYAVRLLTQFYAFGWAGALIVTAIAWHLGWCTDALGRLAGRPRGQLLRCVPCVLLVVMYGSYSHPLGAVLSLQAGLLGFVLYVRWAPQRLWQRLAILLLACAILHHLAGSGSVVFPALGAIYELLVARRPVLAAAAIIFGLVVPSVSAAVFAVDFRQAYGGFLVSDPGVLPGKWPMTLALYVFFPAVLAGSVFAQRLLRAQKTPPRAGRGSPDPALGTTDRSRKSGRPAVGGFSEVGRPAPSAASHGAGKPALRDQPRLAAALAALALLGGGLAAWASLDTLARTVLQIDYQSQRERWSEALAAADRLPAGFYDVRCHRNVMLALYHTGRLGDEMFRYPQRPGVDLFRTPDEAEDPGSHYQESRLFLEMGHVNQAEKCASEALEICGDLPAVLEKLALVNVVKGRPETARIFCNALARHPLHQRAAREMLERLSADPELNGDPRVSRIRRNLVEKDFVELNTSVEEFLLALLEKNPRNRMAFELLMAHFLAVGRTDGVAAWLPKLNDFSYAGIPRLYQEAAIIQARSTGTRPVTPGYELDAAVLARADRFARLTAGARNRQGAMQAALEAGFGDSYFFYWAFGFSGQ